ncbi:hypothetical protein [Rhodococcus rhodochrous]|uniref:hypothetical protein n=1 Tax=Rhodococcus rhodochrous TaxID=1829 RepID=UPI000E72B380|nr:hypothetical protein [Rhodococcus rhodochrous]QHG82118.1 hypothetical protein D1O33_09270 [Rhodococcus rhodochrous]QOH58208.1 hypothetical protein C6Y44_21250 [Rhodococcus rhodochrous]
MSHHDLPVPDYDELAPGTLAPRIRALDEAQLTVLIEHEQKNQNRPNYLEVLTARRDELASGAEPTGGDPTNAPPVDHTSSGSPVDPSHSPDDHTPLRHGVAEQTPKRGKP